MKEKTKAYLLLIIELYIKTGQPVGSKTLLDEYHLNVSPATIRSTMAQLEQEGFLQKAHISSGRIPSAKGFWYYATNAEILEDHALEERLKLIFDNRNLSIDATLNEALNTINEMIGLTLVTSNDASGEILKSIQIIPINHSEAMIILVTSSGRVDSRKISFEFLDVDIEDVKIAVRIFKERLVDTPLSELKEKAINIKPILIQSIKNYERIFQAFVNNIFNFSFTNKIYGKDEIIKYQGFSRERLLYILDLIENNSIWKIIESKSTDEENIKIDVREDNLSLISKKMPYKNSYKEISIIGSNRINYVSAKNALNLLERFLKDIDDENGEKIK